MIRVAIPSVEDAVPAGSSDYFRPFARLGIGIGSDVSDVRRTISAMLGRPFFPGTMHAHRELLDAVSSAAVQGNAAPREAMRAHWRPAALEVATWVDTNATAYRDFWRDRLAALRQALGLAPAITPSAAMLSHQTSVLRTARLLDGDPTHAIGFHEALEWLGLLNFNNAVVRIPAAAPGAALAAIRAEMTTEAVRWAGEVASIYEARFLERRDRLAALRQLLGQVPAVTPPQPALDAALADLRGAGLVD